jgi:hypothetical protein
MSGREHDESTGNGTLAAFVGVTIVAYLAGCGLLYLIFKVIH